MERTVYYEATASIAVRVQVPDDTPADEIEDVAYDKAADKWDTEVSTSLCHHCAGKMDLGDFEPESVEE